MRKRARLIVPIQPEQPMCCHKVYQADTSFKYKQRERNPDLDRYDCHSRASVYIKRKPYCKNHGGMIALQILLYEG